MNLNQNTRRNIVLLVIAFLAFLAVLSPFLISTKLYRALFLVFNFLIVTFFWFKFNQLRIMINKNELEDKKLSEIEHDIEIRSSLIPKDNKEKNN
jgi:predicted membrane protein